MSEAGFYVNENLSVLTFFNLTARGIKASGHMQHSVTKDKMEKTVRCKSISPGIRKQGFLGVGWGFMQTKRPLGAQWLQEWRQEVECELCPKLTQIALHCTLRCRCN